VITLRNLEGKRVSSDLVPETLGTHYSTRQWEPPPPVTKFEPSKYATQWETLPEESNGEFVIDNLLSACRRLKKGKSLKPTGWSNEIFAIAMSILPVRDAFLNLFNALFMFCWIPQLWLLAWVVGIFKKGAKDDPANMRPISLVDVLGKLFVAMITERLYYYMKTRIHRTQYANRKGWGTAGNLWYLLRLIELCHQLSEDSLVAIFIDVKMAFDRVTQEALEDCLKRLGVHGNLLTILLLLHKDLVFRVQHAGKLSSLHKRWRGLRQGDPAAMLLYVLIIAVIYADSHAAVAQSEDDEVREQYENNPVKILELLFADDGVLVSLQSRLKLLTAFFHAVLFEVRRTGGEENRTKTSMVLYTGGSRFDPGYSINEKRQDQKRKQGIT